MAEITGKHVLLKDKDGNYLLPETIKTNTIAENNLNVPTSDAVSKAISNHTHPVSQITNMGCYVAECGTTNFSIKTLTAVNTYVTKTFTGIYKKWNTGIYELYGVVPDKTVPQGVDSYHHTLLFPTGISFAHCPNGNDNDPTRFMYTFVGIEAFDENTATYQQYPLLLDTQYADSLLFSLMYLSDTQVSSGFTFFLIGKLAD